MIAEVITRRFNHPDWQIPDLIIIDGGRGQLSAALKAFRSHNIKIPAIAVAKGPTRKGFRLFRNTPATKITLDKIKERCYNRQVIRKRQFAPRGVPDQHYPKESK